MDSFLEVRKILLEDEQAELEKIEAQIAQLKEKIQHHEKDLLSINPLIDTKLKDFDKKLGPVISQKLKHQVVNERDQMVEALYPIIGGLIKKYIQAEFEKLTEKIEKNTKAIFSFSNLKLKIKSWFTGTKQADLILEASNEASIEEIFVIQSDSGLMMGHYSKNKTLDGDMLSGMLTAIKHFVETAFDAKEDSLETINYGSKKIILQNHYKYYFAVVSSGTVNSEFNSKLSDMLMDFAQKQLNRSYIDINDKIVDKISTQLNFYFNGRF